MSKLRNTLEKGSNFIAYLTAGDPSIDYTVEAILALESAGVSIIELGIPFSDPVADGPVIQRAMQRSLDRGFVMADILTILQRVREKSAIPIILFTYCNPILQAGEEFLIQAKQCGCDALLIVDAPLEELEPFEQITDAIDLELVLLATPSSSKERLEFLSSRAKSCIYYVSRKGVTGEKSSLPADFAKNVEKIRQICSVPIMSGFGISEKNMAHEVLELADGFVVGSAIVSAIEKGSTTTELASLAKSINPLHHLVEEL
ncbi:MAG: tryptophan synthase subunit alpha [Waddliaceae bacterium]|nr:tryptophan synthase subunit alpha [Waddliaceae bacterium]